MCSGFICALAHARRHARACEICWAWSSSLIVFVHMCHCAYLSMEAFLLLSYVRCSFCARFEARVCCLVSVELRCMVALHPCSLSFIVCVCVCVPVAQQACVAYWRDLQAFCCVTVEAQQCRSSLSVLPWQPNLGSVCLPGFYCRYTSSFFSRLSPLRSWSPSRFCCHSLS